MALRLVFVIVAVVIVAVLAGTSGHFFPLAGITSAQAAADTTLLFVLMAATSFNQFHHTGQLQAIACRR